MRCVFRDAAQKYAGRVNWSLTPIPHASMKLQTIRRLVLIAVGDIARARGMMQLARDKGITREGLYKALGAWQPQLCNGYQSHARAGLAVQCGGAVGVELSVK